MAKAENNSGDEGLKAYDVTTNGISLHVTEQGEVPAVLRCACAAAWSLGPNGDVIASEAKQSRERRALLARRPNGAVRVQPPQQPLQMLLSILLFSCRMARSSGVGPAACESPGRGTVSPVDVR